MTDKIVETPVIPRMRRHLQKSEKVEPPHRGYMKIGKTTACGNPNSSKTSKSSSMEDELTKTRRDLLILQESNRQLVAGHKRLSKENHRLKMNDAPNLNVNFDGTDAFGGDGLSEKKGEEVEEVEEYRSSADEIVYPNQAFQKRKQRAKANKKSQGKPPKIQKFETEQDIPNYEKVLYCSEISRNEAEDIMNSNELIALKEPDNLEIDVERDSDNELIGLKEPDDLEIDVERDSHGQSFVTTKKTVMGVEMAKKVFVDDQRKNGYDDPTIRRNSARYWRNNNVFDLQELLRIYENSQTENKDLVCAVLSLTHQVNRLTVSYGKMRKLLKCSDFDTTPYVLRLAYCEDITFTMNNGRNYRILDHIFSKHAQTMAGKTLKKICSVVSRILFKSLLELPGHHVIGMTSVQDEKHDRTYEPINDETIESVAVFVLSGTMGIENDDGDIMQCMQTHIRQVLANLLNNTRKAKKVTANGQLEIAQAQQFFLAHNSE